MNETAKTDIQIYENELLERILKRIEQKGGKELLSSIILTGSFGRNEPSYVFEADGTFQLKSDIEIALIFRRTSSKKRVEELIRAVSADFEEDLNLMAISEKRVKNAHNFNLSFQEPKYKTIFTYDLFNGSRTIWGQDLIGRKVVPVSEIDPYEGLRLVANRIGELVYLQTSSSDPAKVSALRVQWKGKLMLAIGSAWLLSKGEYVSSYRGQYENIKKYAQMANGSLDGAFFVEYEKVFCFLRSNGAPYEVQDEKLYRYVRSINDDLAAHGIDKPRINTASRKLKYCIKYLKAGMPYGMCDFEDHILRMLIDAFCQQRKELANIARVWHCVLY